MNAKWTQKDVNWHQIQSTQTHQEVARNCGLRPAANSLQSGAALHNDLSFVKTRHPTLTQDTPFCDSVCKSSVRLGHLDGQNAWSYALTIKNFTTSLNQDRSLIRNSLKWKIYSKILTGIIVNICLKRSLWQIIKNTINLLFQ